MAFEHRDLKSIGRMAIFYLPEDKVDKAVEHKVHEFLMFSYGGYTLQRGNIKGVWRPDNSEWMSGYGDRYDMNLRYEVSFKGIKRIPMLATFLSILCAELGEETLYLTMGEDSYLVKPREPDSEGSQ